MDLDKALARIKKSRDHYKKKVEGVKKKKMGARQYHLMKRDEKAEKARLEEDRNKNNVIRDLNKRINNSKEGSSEEKELIKRRNRLMSKMGMNPL